MRRLSLFHTIDFLLRQKRRMSTPRFPEIPPAVEPEPAEPAAVWHEAIVAAGPLHALDGAPVNSKIVVVREVNSTAALLALPSGEQVILGGDDPAASLPVGARIQKTAEGEYLASQLGGTQPARISSTAHEAITGFVAHFHP